MPEPGDIVFGEEIGRRAKGRYKYLVCPVCDVRRWVCYTGAQFAMKSPVQRCNACRLKSTKMWIDRGDTKARRY